MKHFVTRMGRAIAGVFGRSTRILQDFPLDLLARRKDLWVGLLRDAMQKSGRGFRQYSLKRVSFAEFAAERTRPFSWGDARKTWQAQRRPDKVAQAERDAKNPVFTGKLNYRRSDRPQ
jgi:hypothetical protein